MNDTTIKRKILGSANEGDLLDVPNKDWVKQNEDDWNRVYQYCSKISGVDEYGLLNEHPNIEGSVGQDAVRSGVFLYRKTIIGNFNAIEYVYLAPAMWGTRDFGGGVWVDEDNCGFDSPVYHDGVFRNSDKNMVIVIKDGVKTYIPAMEYYKMTHKD